MNKPTVQQDSIKQTQAVAAVTGRMFCRHHRGEVEADKGRYETKGKLKMWICDRCRERRDAAIKKVEERK